ncbi:Zn-dependent hydrolase [Bacillus sp. B190/17]|uniref:Zn-dependent hydrolase n=1 Tax=Bacillus lumedeiriae TaxID=3058829 RepID=A0ABW8I8C9_9BACI
MKINMDRLLLDIEKYAQYGKSEHGGVTRPSFSKADHDVRKLFIQELKDMGLLVTIDGAANIWGRRKGTGKKQGTIVIGSHLDSVPNGGKYDGPLGVLMAKELIKTLIENNIHLDHDLEIVSFTAEESNDFNLSTFGSRAFAGKLTAEVLEKASDSKGTLIKDELEKAGGGLDKFPVMAEAAKQKKAFIELHIEQGKRLESRGLSMAVINKFVGMYRSTVQVIGQANHSGTTMMEHRNDALSAAAEMVLEVERQCREDQTDLVGTVGKLNVFPNATNIIPGHVTFNFEVRGENGQHIHDIVNSIRERWKEIARKRQVDIQEDVFLDQDPIELDHDIVHVLECTAEEMNEPCITFASMAVHDAAHMAAVTKSTMIFVKSIGGKSHCPEEYSVPHDIEKAGNLMLCGVINIDKELDKEYKSVTMVTRVNN